MLKKIFSCLFLCFVIVSSSFAQNNDKIISLKTILDNLSKKHKVTFNYIEDEIIIFKLIPPEKKLTLIEKLDYISAKTKLEFKIITATYISVINNKKLDKPLCGFLIDEETKVPLELATIRVLGTNYSTFTNDKGYFELQLKSPNDIEISHVNYPKITLKLDQLYKENCPTFTLKQFTNELEEVTTQIYLTKGIAKKLDGTYQIKPKKFGLLPGLTEPDVFETLKQVPGFTSNDETVSNITVRGGTHDQNLFLWNGIRLFQTSHFFGLISALNPNLAQTVKVTKNGSSPFYGESVSSVIDISTHSDNLEGNNYSFGINMINADAYAKIKTSNTSSLEISGRRSLTDVIESPTYKSYYNRVFQNTIVTNLSTNEAISIANDEKFYFYDFTLQFHQKIKKKSDLFVDAIGISNHFELTQTKTENNTTTVRDSNLKQNTKGANILFRTNWNVNNSSELSVYASNYSIISENESIQNTQIFNQENTSFDTGLRLKNSHQLSKSLNFNNGYQLNEIGVTNFDQVNSPVFYRKIKDVLRTHALIAELKYQSTNNKILTTIGVRENYIEQLAEFIFEPRLQFNYAISRFFNLEALAEMKSQTSTQIIDLQQDFLGVEKRRWILSNNEDIPIIKNKQVSVGFTFKKNNWLVTLDNFYKNVNGITSSSQGFQNQLEFLKINGSYTIIGSEFLIQKQFKKITTWLSYTYSKNDYTFDGFVPPNFPNNFEIQHNIGSAVIYDYKKIKMALGSRWFTGKPNTVPSSNTPIFNTSGIPEIAYNLPNSSNLDDYFQLNLSGSYTFSLTKKTHLQLGFSIQNLLDTENNINQSFSVNQSATAIEQINTFALERSINSFLRINF